METPVSGMKVAVHQTATELASHQGVVWPDSLSVGLVGGAGLQQMFCGLTASSAKALLHMTNAEFGV